LSTLTLGLIAFGNIARHVAKKMRPFGCEIICYDPYFKDDKKQYSWIEFVGLDQLLAMSDIISLHTPLTKETHRLINEETIKRMKDGVIIINSARGGLIDEKSLVEGVENGKISLAGLDATSIDQSNNNYTSIKELQKKVALNVYHCLKDGEPLYKV